MMKNLNNVKWKIAIKFSIKNTFSNSTKSFQNVNLNSIYGLYGYLLILKINTQFKNFLTILNFFFFYRVIPRYPQNFYP